MGMILTMLGPGGIYGSSNDSTFRKYINNTFMYRLLEVNHNGSEIPSQTK